MIQEIQIHQVEKTCSRSHWEEESCCYWPPDLEAVDESVGPKEEVDGADEAQLADERHRDGAGEPVTGDERNAPEPVPQVRHADADAAAAAAEDLQEPTAEREARAPGG